MRNKLVKLLKGYTQKEYDDLRKENDAIIETNIRLMQTIQNSHNQKELKRSK
jgi:hypothetical protein